MVNNAARALVNRLTVKFAEEIVQETNGYDFDYFELLNQLIQLSKWFNWT